MTKHFAVLNPICQSFSHLVNLLMSSCKISQSFTDFICRYKIQSSANKRTCDLTADGRSLMCIRKSSGPSTVPCGTPDVTGELVDWEPSSTTF